MPHFISELHLKISSVLVDGKLQGFPIYFFLDFLDQCKEVGTLPKIHPPHQTHTPSHLQAKKSYCLEDSVLTILEFIQISVVSISKASTKSKSSNYKNDSRSVVGKYYLKNIFLSGGLITTSFQNT